MVLASWMRHQDRVKREAWLNSNLRTWAKEHGIPIEEFPEHYERAEGFAIAYAKGHEKGFDIGYEKGIAAAKARDTLNDKLRALGEKYGIPENELPFSDGDE